METLQDRKDFMKIDLTLENTERLLEECQELRKRFQRLKNISDESLIISALQMYKRQKNRVLRNKLKRGNNLK